MPSTEAMAAEWGSHSSNVHAALTTLVQEGLLVRKAGVGTVVNEPQKKLERVALYSMNEVNLNPITAFDRGVHSAVSAEYGRRGVQVETIIDPRPRAEQFDPPPLLLEAALDRRIQAVAAADVRPAQVRWLRKLPVVGAFVATLKFPNTVRVESHDFLRRSLCALYDKGIRRVGLIDSHFQLPDNCVRDLGGLANPNEEFLALGAELGMETRPEWTKMPEEEIAGEMYEPFGHWAFKKLWSESERPEGLVVFTDFVARGVLHGILEMGVLIPDDLQLVLQRNIELPYYCPVPATFVEVSICRVASALVELIDRQFRGETVCGVSVPYAVTEEQSREVWAHYGAL